MVKDFEERQSELQEQRLVYTPTTIKDSPFHAFVTKDLALSHYANKEDIELISAYHSLINDFLAFGIEEMALWYDSEKLTYITALKGIGEDRERKLMITSRQESTGTLTREQPQGGKYP